MGANTPDVVIIGGGLTGISAAMHLRHRWLLLEKNERLGGHARTDKRDDFCFDKTGHWLHLRDPYTQGLIKELLGDAMVPVARKARIFVNGALTRYPFQANLYGQPPDVISECLLGFIAAYLDRKGGEPAEPKNFEDFIYKTFGAGIAKHFMIPYNYKLWGVHPREITAAWCTRFVPKPSLADVVAGAVGANSAEMGYNISFLYPKEGGIETMTRALIGRIDQDRGKLCTNTSPDVIDVATRTVEVGGESIPYQAVIATLPLPELLKRTRGMPKPVEEAASRLRCTPVRYLNVATKSPTPADFHWIYAPEGHLPFYRVGIYSNAVPSMAPRGHGSLYVELSDRGRMPTGAGLDALRRDTAQALAAAGAIKDADDILFADVKELEYAYVVFDDHYYQATKTIFAWLDLHNIYSRGRYGSWTYNSMEDCILAGKQAAIAIDQKLDQEKSDG